MARKKAQVKAVRSRDTIVLVYKRKTLNIQKKQKSEYFAEIVRLMKKKDMDSLIEKFLEISEGVEKFTKGNFSVDGDKREVYFKGDITTPMPVAFVTKLKDFYATNQDFQPLLRFWKKVLLNPNPQSRLELFDFMEKTNIPLTEEGDIIVEKGVKQRADGTLVDGRTSKVDNSIGMTVRMPVEMVDNNRRNECSNGLHVGAPDFVRNHWHDPIILTCIVSPEHVVSVPQDYNATKMRVCEYRVIGLAEKSNIDPSKLVFKLEDIFDMDAAVESAKKRKGKVSVKEESKKSMNDAQKSVLSEIYIKDGLSAMSGKAIKAMVLAEFEVKITKKLKADIVSEAIHIAEENRVTNEYTEKDFEGLTNPQIISKVKADHDVEIQKKKKNKAILIAEAIEISKR